MLRKKWNVTICMVVLGILAGASQADIIFDDEFGGSSLGSHWDWYTGSGWSQSVGGGTLTITANTTGTRAAGLVLNTPLSVGSADGQLQVTMRIKNNVSSGHLVTNFGFVTSDPGEPEGLDCDGWAYYQYDGYDNDDPAPGSNTRIYIDGSQTTDIFYGNIHNYLADDAYGYVRIRMYTDPGEERFAVLVSNNGTNWQIVGNHALTSAEIAGLTQGQYYVLLRTVTLGATQATMDIDHIWADAVPEPTTMALLSIGGFGALLRRRR